MGWSATVRELAERWNASWRGEGDLRLTRVVVDSRVGLRAGDLFVALPGRFGHGVDHADAAWKAGAAVLSDVEPSGGEGPWIRVHDALQALQSMAAEHRRGFSGEVVAITGSNGKTIVKEMLRALLHASHVAAEVAPLSWNSQIGVPLALLSMDLEAAVWVVECGISEPGEMERLARLVAPTIGAWTVIGSAHGESLGGEEGIEEEKARLFFWNGDIRPGLRCVVAGDERVAQALERRGLRGSSIVRASSSTEEADDPMEANRRVAFALASRLGASAAPELLRGWQPPSMRLQEMQTPQGWTLINDAGTSDAAGVAAALRVARKAAGSRPLRVVLGPLALSGSAQARAHLQVAESVAAAAPVEVVVVADPEERLATPLRNRLGTHVPVKPLPSREAVARHLAQSASAGDVIVLKASRHAHLGDLAGLLAAEVPATRALVDLDAVVANWRAVQRRVGTQVQVMVMLKAFGYGLDATRLALALQSAGAQWFGVAVVDEALALRRAGVTGSILVQNIFPHEVEAVVRHGLDAEVASFELLDALAEEGERKRAPVAVHVKVDTGMERVGFRTQDLREVARRVDAVAWLQWAGLMTHFAVADDPSEDAFTRTQIAAFEVSRQRIEGLGFSPPWLHLANTAGLARFPESRGSLVRLGIGLYGGVSAALMRELGLQPVVTLRSRVLQVRDVPEGHSVGYGRTWVAGPGGARIATVAIGYGDGYPRALSNRGWMRIRGGRAPVVGRVCMDVTLVEVTGLPDVRSGDDVVVYGAEPGDPTLDELARLADTIPYELLTRLAPRARRVFERTDG